MTDVLLIGYNDHRLAEELSPGTLTDMRYVYNHIRDLDPRNILVITDILEKDNVKKKVTDPNDVFFINSIGSFGELYLFRGKSDLNDRIKKFVTKSNKLVVYFSGHAFEQKIILPNPVKIKSKHESKEDVFSSEVSYLDFSTEILEANSDVVTNIKTEGTAERGETKGIVSGSNKISQKSESNQSLSFGYLKSIVILNTNRNAQILFILDCCSGNGLNLPFLMDGKGVYYLKGESPRIPTQEIVCISASL